MTIFEKIKNFENPAVEMTNTEMANLYNELVGPEKAIKKFKDKATAVARLTSEIAMFDKNMGFDKTTTEVVEAPKVVKAAAQKPATKKSRAPSTRVNKTQMLRNILVDDHEGKKTSFLIEDICNQLEWSRKKLLDTLWLLNSRDGGIFVEYGKTHVKVLW